MATVATDSSGVATLSLATATLPSQISISVTSVGTDAITSAAAPTSFTILSLTLQSIVTDAGGAISTTAYVATSVVTDAAQFSSLSSAAIASASSKTQAPSSNSASSSSTAAISSKSSSSSSSASPSSSPSLSTIVPAVIVPVLFLLVALALGWFLLKRRRKSKSQAGYTQDRNDKLELDTTELSRTHGRAELNGRGDAEALSSGSSENHSPVGPVHELPASMDGIAELEGDVTRRHEGG